MPTPLNRRIRSAAGGNNIRKRKPRLPGQSPPILNRNQPMPGAPTKPQTPPAQAPLPTLNQNQQQMLQEQFSGQQGFGPAAGPGLPTVRRLMRQGAASGLGNAQVNNLANPALYRGANDPNGGGSLLRNLDPDMLKRLAAYGGQQQGTGLQQGGSTEAQAAFFAAFPELQQQYISQANSYKAAPMSDMQTGGTTPPNATLGADGKYHDPTQPYEGSTTPAAPQAPAQPQTPTTPQTGAQTPQNQQPGLRQQTPIATPDAARAAGKDPTKHIAYWEAAGFSYNPATDTFTDRNGDRPNPKPPGGQGQGQGQTPQTPGVPTPGQPQPGQPTGAQPSSQLPLDPMYEAQRRGLDSDLQRQLASVNAGQGRLTAEQQLAEARLGTNQGIDVQRLKENMASRGTMNSSIYGDQTGLLATDYQRQHQDLASSIADAMAGLSGQEGDAQSSYEMGLLEALLGSAQRSADDPYTVTPRPAKKKPRKRPRKRKRGN